MMGPTHALIGGASWLGGLAAFTAAGPASPVSLGAALGGAAIAAVAALLPDIDSKNSLASKMLGPITGAVSWVVRKTFGGHRQITHSLLGLALIGVLMAVCLQAHLIPWIAAAVLAGWSSHVLADMLTKEGCPLLWPLDKHNYGVHLVTTGKRVEKFIIHPLAYVAIAGFSILLVIGV